MHTDDTLKLLDDSTKDLGVKFREFVKKTCPAFNTRELQSEVDARKHRQAKKERKDAVCAQSSSSASATMERSSQSGRLKKQFNLQTYKFHALGDYAATIGRYGTTDSFSTERVSSTCYFFFAHS